MPTYEIDQEHFRKHSSYSCYLKKITQRKITAPTRREATGRYKKEIKKHALEIWNGMFLEIKRQIKWFDNDSANENDRAHMSMALELPGPDQIKKELTRTIYKSLTEVEK